MTPMPALDLDHPSLDAERAAIACDLLGDLASSLARGLREGNSHHDWFAQTAKRLERHARDLRLGGAAEPHPGVAGEAPAVSPVLRLVV